MTPDSHTEAIQRAFEELAAAFARLLPHVQEYLRTIGHGDTPLTAEELAALAQEGSDAGTV